jgi:hypothetical protein
MLNTNKTTKKYHIFGDIFWVFIIKTTLETHYILDRIQNICFIERVSLFDKYLLLLRVKIR